MMHHKKCDFLLEIVKSWGGPFYSFGRPSPPYRYLPFSPLCYVLRKLSSSRFTPTTHPPTHQARTRRWAPELSCGGGWWVGGWVGAAAAFPPTPARAPGRCRAAAAARVRRRGPCQARQRSKTASGRRQPALHRTRHRCSTQEGTHRACVDLHSTAERGAAACAAPQLEYLSHAAEMHARSRAQRLLLPFSPLILRFGQLSPFTDCIEGMERSGSGRRSATARPQLVRDASQRWAKHV